ncbi:nucleotidyltransferase domain-containing protein [Rathayibacter festucae]|uniref:nucleotidyltransferase domain-containing protein n=1 Tax=Rathayibacter festucae TaxID=110937 RepID=UPI002A6A665A|nr:nucleotidyltransferase domain-containing protein [Rathayibacter festucae]MDY0913796.1 nucleotidyltransferase domain-containing protein [Rathayibacter festucae]
MRTQRPLAVVTPTVDGDVLTVLARADDWFTVGELRTRIGSRSLEGIRRTLTRLVEEGIVTSQAVGRTTIYRLNRSHLAAGAIMELARLDETLHERLVSTLEGWAHQPGYAAMFGSAARGEMRAGSDLDLFLQQPAAPTDAWHEQVSALVRDAKAWTGNDPRVLEMSEGELRDAAADEPVLRSIVDEGIPLIGSPLAFRRLVGAR